MTNQEVLAEAIRIMRSKRCPNHGNYCYGPECHSFVETIVSAPGDKDITIGMYDGIAGCASSSMAVEYVRASKIKRDRESLNDREAPERSPASDDERRTDEVISMYHIGNGLSRQKQTKGE